jgi:hypothetical protein
LRDLGCHVQLHEEWTGKGGANMTNWNNLKRWERSIIILSITLHNEMAALYNYRPTIEKSEINNLWIVFLSFFSQQ